MIVIDDGSENHIVVTPDVFDFELHLFRHEENLGLPSALNTGLTNTSTRYFVRLDSDDYVNKNFLLFLLAAIPVLPLPIVKSKTT